MMYAYTAFAHKRRMATNDEWWCSKKHMTETWRNIKRCCGGEPYILNTKYRVVTCKESILSRLLLRKFSWYKLAIIMVIWSAMGDDYLGMLFVSCAYDGGYRMNILCVIIEREQRNKLSEELLLYYKFSLFCAHSSFNSYLYLLLLLSLFHLEFWCERGHNVKRNSSVAFVIS